MKDKKRITKQQEFVKWLKDNQMYNQIESATIMQKMFKVWMMLQPVSKYLVVVRCDQGYETEVTLFDTKEDADEIANKSNNQWSSLVEIHTITSTEVLRDVPYRR